MTTKERVTRAIFRAIDDVNKQLRPEERLQKSSSTIISGSSARLDSLGLVNLIVTAEECLETEFASQVILTNDEILSQNGLSSIGTLIDYVCAVLEDRSNA